MPVGKFFLILMLVLGVIFPAATDAASQTRALDTVAIDTHEAAYTVYYLFPHESQAQFLEKIRKSGLTPDKITIVSLTELAARADELIRKKVIQKDYPQFDPGDGFLKLIQAGFATAGLGLTWNGGIAVTYNDFQFAKKSYQKFKTGNWKLPAPAADPVYPAHHLQLLDSDYLKKLQTQ